MAAWRPPIDHCAAGEVMDTTALERLDSFPYRHRVGELMTRPVATIDAARPVAEAARLMNEQRISSVIVLDDDGRLHGILTERDLLRLVARGSGGLAGPVAAAMSSPVHAIEADAPVYRALARMARLDVRHLPVVDDDDRPIGMLTSSALLKQRASLALTLGDEVACAEDGPALRAIHDKLAALVRALRREDVSAVQASAVVSGITRDLTARAGELALAEMTSAGEGGPPAPWCLLVLGSAGRGETLMAPDQDNALIHEGGAGDDVWFSRFAERLNRLLDEAGVPYCRGGVMAKNPAYRHSLAEWQAEVDGWVARPQPKALLGVDIFYDFTAVLGTRRLAGALRDHATRATQRSPLFLRLLAAASEDAPHATDLLGRLRTRGGRIDLKHYGLFPIVAGARAASLAWGSTATATDARLTEASAKGAFPPDAARSLIEARSVLVEAILDQQLEDIAAGRSPDSQVDPKRLDRRATSRLREALAAASEMPEIVHEALSNRPITSAS
jgi:signal-transduction protein with cAMP-binding, CBS, and nucleotidyltransferase domain